jgi:TonB family protein
MQCERSHSDELRFVQGFTFLLYQTFKLYGITYEPAESILSNYSSIRIRQERENYKKSHPDQYKLYYSQYSNGDYIIDIQKEYRYILRYRQLIISEGIWKKKGNELLLFDNSLQYMFTILIGKEGLIGKYLPGNFNNLILYKKNDPFKKEIVTIHSITHSTPVFENDVDPNEPLHFAEDMPQFPNGGEKAMVRFIKKNTHYPESARKAGIKGHAVLNCVIEKDGTISTIKVMKKLSPECDEEAMRVIKSMPKWIPGRHNGINVAVRYTIAVDFGIK